MLAALINKSVVDFKIAFFSLKELLIKSWRKATIKICHCSERLLHAKCFTCISNHIQTYKLLSHFHRGRNEELAGLNGKPKNRI